MIARARRSTRFALQANAIVRSSVAALAALGPWLASAGVSAQAAELHGQVPRTVLIAPKLEPRQRAAVVQGLASVGVRAASAQDAELDSVFEACSTLPCLLEAARVSGARVSYAEVAAAGGGGTLLWVLADPDGAKAQQRIAVHDRDLAAAARQGWSDGSLALSLRDDALVRVETSPAGASVYLDAVRVGSTPWVGRSAAGQHRLVFKLDGFVAQERDIELRAGEATPVHVQLVRAPRYDPPARARGRSSPWNYVIGGTLALLATPALVNSFQAFARDGQCLSLPDRNGLCRDRAHFGSASAVALSAGLIGLAAGITVLAGQPIRSESAIPLAARPPQR